MASYSPAGIPRPADTGNGASSVYYARASSADPAAVVAPLGGLGRISVSFHPSGERRVTVLRPGNCPRPTRIVRRLGTFSGTIEFQGEDGYTAVAATRARGSVGTPLPAGCASASASSWPAPGAAVLRAVNQRAGTSFKATTTATGVAFVAVLEERLGDGVLVSRRAYAGAPPSTFSFDGALTWARVKPPAPFSGVPHSAAGPGRRGATWEGNLRATFPGATVPMTGPGFKPSLRSGRGAAPGPGGTSSAAGSASSGRWLVPVSPTPSGRPRSTAPSGRRLSSPRPIPKPPSP
jgi:hypothetical protein